MSKIRKDLPAVAEELKGPQNDGLKVCPVPKCHQGARFMATTAPQIVEKVATVCTVMALD